MSDDEEVILEDGDDEEDIELGSNEDMEDEDGEEEVDSSNTYYNAKGSIEEDIDEALELFEAVLDMEEEKGQWGFKALKQMVKLNFRLNKYTDMLKRYKQLLDYMSIVTRNESETAINKVLNMVSSSTDQKLLSNVYSESLEALKKAGNEKLWFNTKLKQGKLYMDSHDYDSLRRVIQELKDWCKTPDGKLDMKKDTNLLDIYVLEIQMYSDLNDLKKLAELYKSCNQLSSNAVVLNPRVTGVIRECGGKMYMREKKWKNAYEDFFEAFKSYDEAGNPRRIECLKYLVLSNLLSSNDINPFDANEAKPYKTHSEIVAMTELVSAYQNNNIKSFEKILKQNKKTIAEDPFIRTYIPDLLNNIRTKVLLRLIKPYTRIKMDFVAKELFITIQDVEKLCVDLILDQQLDGFIDQIQGMVTLGAKGSESTRYKAINSWSQRLADIHGAVLGKIN
ncbi:Cops2 [Acrasis kona]|uniref:Cops2 n=1 Tax=Acrasis kona TaxID=1008807 RepID=A0AAW2ZLA5_9EUKA